MALDPGILPGPARSLSKSAVFARDLRHLRRRDTSMCLEAEAWLYAAGLGAPAAGASRLLLRQAS